MALSQRGREWASMASDLLIWQVLKDLWDPNDNPNGFVSLGVAENALMHSEMTKYINANVKLPPLGLTYGDGGSGSRKLQATMARFLTRKLKPVTTIEASHMCITNGVSSGIEHLSGILADKGDVFLLGQPYYGAFIHDIELRPEVKAMQVAFGDVDPLSLAAVSAYEEAVRTCKERGQRVAGLMLCNPHNPLGRCYPRDYIIELMKLCQKHQIHLISDEIYALSVFRKTDQADNSVIPFTSLASIPTQGLINPALTHILYGLSKDFGANGLRLGFIVSQHNPELHKALVPVSIYSYTSSLADDIAVTLLSDDEFVDWYIAENCRRLKKNYELVAAWADRHQIEYKKGVNAAFFLWVNLGQIYSRAAKEGAIQSESTDRIEAQLKKTQIQQKSSPEVLPSGEKWAEDDMNVLVNYALISNKIFLASGAAFGSEQPGWFRIVFSQSEQNLREGLRRIEKAFGLCDGRAKL